MNYEKAWVMLKEDLKDLIQYNNRFKNDDYDKYAVTEDLSKRLLFQMETYEEQVGKEPKKTDYKLKGWDYQELVQLFGIEYYEPKDDEPMHYIYTADDALEYNKVLHFLQDNYENEEVINAVREHLRKMISDPIGGYYAPVWKGMLEIEDNYVFMQFVFALLSHMWT